MSNPIRLLVADDQAVVRSGYQLIFQSSTDIEIVAEAATGLEAVQLTTDLHPDVVIMDIRMPVMDGVEATQRIAQHFDQPHTVSAMCPRIVVLTTFDDEDYIYSSLRAGATSFLLKDAPSEDIISAIRHANLGETVLSPSVTTMLMGRHVRPVLERNIDRSATTLTKRETEVMTLISKGLSNAEISTQLYISERTVKSHITTLFAKLGLNSRVQVVIYAYENGIVPGSF